MTSLAAINLGTGRTAKEISVGGGHVCAVLDDDTLKCWGSNGFGQLGLGNTVNRGYTTGQMGDSLPIVDVGSGHNVRSVIIGRSKFRCALSRFALGLAADLEQSTFRLLGVANTWVRTAA